MAIYYESYQGCQTAEGEFILHYRTKGSKNGQRLYQNKDGSLTPLGREHYGVGKPRNKAKTDRQQFGLTEHGRKLAKENGTEKYWDDNTKKEAKEMRAHKAKSVKRQAADPERAAKYDDPSDDERVSYVKKLVAEGASDADIKLKTGVDLTRPANAGIRKKYERPEPSDDDITAFFDDKETHEKYTTQVAKEKWNEASDALKKAWGSLDGAKEQYRYSADVFEKYWKDKKQTRKAEQKKMFELMDKDIADGDEENYYELKPYVDRIYNAIGSKAVDDAASRLDDANDALTAKLKEYKKTNKPKPFENGIAGLKEYGQNLKRYKEARDSDPDIQKLTKKRDQAELEYAGRLLKEAGYDDTKQNRKRLRAYMISDGTFGWNRSSM